MTLLDSSFIFLSFNDIGIIAGIISAIVAIVGLFIKYITLTNKAQALEDLNPSLDVLVNYGEVWKKALEVFKEELAIGGGLKIKNVGLDLEKILPDLKDFINEKVKNNPRVRLSYSGLIVDPSSQLIEPLINGASNIKTEYVISAHKKLEDYKELYRNDANIKLEVKSYFLPPVIHGILVNNKHLFLGFTEITNGKLFGSECPYIYLKYKQDIVATSHYFSVFNKWFDYYWNYEYKKL